MGGTVRLAPVEFLTLRLVCYSQLQQFLSYSLGFPSLVLVPMEVSVQGFLLHEVVFLSVHLPVSPLWSASGGSGASLL